MDRGKAWVPENDGGGVNHDGYCRLHDRVFIGGALAVVGLLYSRAGHVAAVADRHDGDDGNIGAARQQRAGDGDAGNGFARRHRLRADRHEFFDGPDRKKLSYRFFDPDRRRHHFGACRAYAAVKSENPAPCSGRIGG